MHCLSDCWLISTSNQGPGCLVDRPKRSRLEDLKTLKTKCPPHRQRIIGSLKKDPSLPIHYGTLRTLRTPHYEHHYEHYEQCLPFFSSSSSYPHSTTRLLLPSPRCESGHNSPSLNQKTKITPKTGVGDEGKLHSSWHCTTSTTNTMVSTMKSSPTPHFKPRFTTASATRVSPW